MTRSHASGTSAAASSAAGSARAASTTAGSWPWPRRRAERLDRRLPIARVRDRDEILGDAHDAQRPGDLLAGRLPGSPLPSQRSVSCPSAQRDLLGQMQAPGEQRCRPRTGSRPSARTASGPHQHPATASRTRSGSGRSSANRRRKYRMSSRRLATAGPRTLRTALEVDVVAADPAREVRGRRRCSPRAPPARRSRPPSAPRRSSRAGPPAQAPKAHPELVLERLPEPEIGRQRKRRHQLGRANTPRGPRPLHVPSLGLRVVRRDRPHPSGTHAHSRRPNTSPYLAPDPWRPDINVSGLVHRVAVLLAVAALVGCGSEAGLGLDSTPVGTSATDKS